ncbi:MAG: transcriptional repressor [Desulfovibrio sp.]|nr:transcriptional repressor [Desulfovibrio sp.]
MAKAASEDCVRLGLQLAERICQQRKMRLTPLRRQVLVHLLEAQKPVKAYDLLESLSHAKRRLTPATIYRILDFLVDCGLVHKIASLNSYLPCTCEHHDNSLLLFVCSRCKKAQEMDDPELYVALKKRFGELGMALENGSIEMQGICHACSQEEG